MCPVVYISVVYSFCVSVVSCYVSLSCVVCRVSHFVFLLCHTFFDGCCSTVQGLLDWFEVDLGFTELSFIQIDLCVLCDNKEGTYLIYIQDITHSYMRHDSFMHVTRLIHTYELFMSRI